MRMNSQIGIHQTYESIRNILNEARKYVSYAVNFSMVQAYWNIGKIIVEEEQHGKERADYGKALIKELSIRLTKEFCKGFSEQSLRNMRQFYYCFSIRSTFRSKLVNGNNKYEIKHSALRSELSWTHYKLLLRIGNPIARE